MKKIKFENGTLISNAKVEVGGTIYDVTPEQYEGTTPLSALNMNLIQDNAEEAINGISANLEQLEEEIENKHTYSTEETKVGTWIDGKPIYRKVIEYSTQPASGSNTFYHGISNVDKFIDIETKIYRKDGVQHFAPRYTPGENSWNFYYDDITKTKIAFNCGSQLRSGTYWGTSYFIFEYTKTTD